MYRLTTRSILPLIYVGVDGGQTDYDGGSSGLNLRKSFMASTNQLLLNEMNHRCANDLQMIIGLLSLQSYRAKNEETKGVLDDLIERISVVAKARSFLQHSPSLTLEAALAGVVSALTTYAEPYGIHIAFSPGKTVRNLTDNRIMILSIAINELATNAIKYAFHKGVPGIITISIKDETENDLIIIVDDDGLPFPTFEDRKTGGLGLSLVTMLLHSIGAHMELPPPGKKCFEITVPDDHAPAIG